MDIFRRTYKRWHCKKSELRGAEENGPPDGDLVPHKQRKRIGNDPQASTEKRFLLILNITLGWCFSGLPWQSMVKT